MKRWRARAGAGAEAVASLLLVTALAFEIGPHSLAVEFALCLAAGVLFLVAAALTSESRRPWLAVIASLSFVIAVALLVRMVEAPWLNGLHLVPLTLIACAAAVGRRTAMRHRTLDRQWRQARRDGEERERRYWARELHDDTLQDLGAVQIVLTSASASSGPGAVKEAIDQARRLIGNQIASLRHLIAELRPVALDQLGLRPALEALCRNTSLTFDVDAELRVGAGWDESGGRLSPEAQAHVYRIVQEAVTNAVKHARPARILVELGRDGRTVGATVTDDGTGLAPEAASAVLTRSRAMSGAGIGMAAMRERADLLDGELTVRSAPGEGTSVALRVPLHGKGGRRRRS